MKVIIWGTGIHLKKYESLIAKENILCFMDSEEKKQGNILWEKEIVSPERIHDYKYDFIVIASKNYFYEIRNELEIKYGIDSRLIINLEFYLYLTNGIELKKILKDFINILGAYSVECGIINILDFGCSLSNMKYIGWDSRIKIDGYCPHKSCGNFLYQEEFTSVNTINRLYDIVLILEPTEINENLLPDIGRLSDNVWILVDANHLDKIQYKNKLEIINLKGFLLANISVLDKSKLQIYEVTHKKFLPINSDIYIPIAVCEISDFTDGLSAFVGDHIAHLNSIINEWTAIYWIWKNENTDYIGINHYRRFFVSNLLGGCIQQCEVFALLKQYDVLVAKQAYFQDLSVYEMLKREIDLEAYTSAINALESIFLEKSSKEQAAYKYVFEGNMIFPCNMFIMSRDCLEQYCLWLFPILIKMIEQVEICENWDDYSKRVIGFIAERLLTVWLIMDRKKMKELDVIFRG